MNLFMQEPIIVLINSVADSTALATALHQQKVSPYWPPSYCLGGANNRYCGIRSADKHGLNHWGSVGPYLPKIWTDPPTFYIAF